MSSSGIMGGVRIAQSSVNDDASARDRRSQGISSRRKSMDGEWRETAKPFLMRNEQVILEVSETRRYGWLSVLVSLVLITLGAMR